jgi:hypothetical protein
MNVNDAEQEEITSDMLEMIFTRQTELMKKYHQIEAEKGLLLTPDVPVDIDSHLGQARLKDFAWRITEELGEAMGCLKNRPWKQTQMHTDIVHYQEEIVDALHFFIELCILSGFTARSLTELYLKKSLVNKFRQGSQY